MKNKIYILLITVIFIIYTGCNKNAANSDNNSASYKVGIAVINNHPALLEIEKGIIDELKAQNMNVLIDSQNANNDANIINAIASKFATDKKDLSIGIATPTAVALANSIKDRPVLFATVNDPIGAGLVDSLDKGKNNVTGLSDALPIKEHLKIYHSIYPFKKLGFIYNGAERNSITMLKITQEVCKEMGIELLPITIYSSVEVNMAAESLVSRVDAFYCFTDNSIATAMSALTDTAKQNKIPVFGGDITPTLNGGVVYALGFSYYEMGRMTGRLIAEVLQGKKAEELPIQSLNDPKFYNKLLDLDTAKLLGITFSDELINSAQYLIKDGKLITK